MQCNKGPDVYAWGQNNYKQVDGISEDAVIQEPTIIPFFLKKKPKLVAHVAVCRSRSVAVMTDGEVYEWVHFYGFRANCCIALICIP